jgi:hypothetical protein
LFGEHCDRAVRLDVRHAASSAFSLKVTDELIKIDVVSYVEADMHRPGIRRARAISRRRKARSAALRLLLVPVLQKLDDDVVELDEAYVQALRATTQIRNPDGSRIYLFAAGFDLLV